MILDATCGHREMWFNKENPKTIYADLRAKKVFANETLLTEIKPDIVCDNRILPFKTDFFDMVIYDPPHLIHDPEKVARLKGCYLQKKYGTLDPKTWCKDIYRASRECFRVLKSGGFLCFKWNDHDRTLDRIVALFPKPPLFGSKNPTRIRGNTTYFVVFQK